MILEVPTHEDFEQHGFMFLNLAWDAAIELMLDIHDFDSTEKSVVADYWESALKPLSVAHALAQQGAELLLKAKIAKVSPYLLIDSPVSSWPGGSGTRDIHFAEFRTVDAQDLPKIYNTVHKHNLPDEFIERYVKFKNSRNTLFHSVDLRIEASVNSVVEYILELSKFMRPEGSWVSLREEYIERTPVVTVYGSDYLHNRIVREMTTVLTYLKPAGLEKWFGFNKRQRAYLCSNCWEQMDLDYDPEPPQTAQLSPNTSDSTEIYCFVCQEEFSVERIDCFDSDCKGNVIASSDTRMCLTCFAEQ